jgi:CRP/FNR family cyclic AMP-dependent transcriptional regulator
MASNVPSIVAGLDEADMLWLLSIGKLRRLKPGGRLVEAGRPIADLFFVLHGALAVIRPDGVRVTTLGEGQVVGEMSFVDHVTPSTRVEAEEAAEMLAVPRQLILDRLTSEPVFAARFYRALAVFLAARLRDTTAAFDSFEIEKDPGESGFHGEARFRRLVGMLKRGAPGRA